jgi:hypothetical protein
VKFHHQRVKVVEKSVIHNRITSLPFLPSIMQGYLLKDKKRALPGSNAGEVIY